MSKPFDGEDMAATMERVARDDYYETRACHKPCFEGRRKYRGIRAGEPC